MESQKKSISEIRKKQICQAAIQCFVEKGFHKTSMEDVIERTQLSKGGVYYYYKNTRDMIFDIFIEGNNYRIGIIKDYIEKNNLTEEDFKNPEIMAELLVEKILADNYLMKVYAQFIVEINYDKDLYETYEKIVEKSRESLYKLFAIKNETSQTRENFIFLTNLVNTFIVGGNILGVRENFEKNRDILKEMIKVGFLHFKEENKK